MISFNNYSDLSCINVNFRNRRDRESSILKAIEEGRTTLFDIVATVYMNVDRGLWFAAASNVKLHVEHLAQQNRLPKVTSTKLIHVIIVRTNVCCDSCSPFWSNVFQLDNL